MPLFEHVASLGSVLTGAKTACILAGVGLLAALAAGRVPRLGRGAEDTPARPTSRESLNRTLSVERLRPSFGHRMMQTALAVVLIALSSEWPLIGDAGWDAPILLALKLGLIALLVWHAAQAWLWELRYDAIGVSAPGWLLRRESRLWRELCQVSTDGPLVLQLHFADGLVMRLPNHLHGRDHLLDQALFWLPSADTTRSG